MAITNIIWPIQLPQNFLIEGYSDSPAAILIRTSLDAALPKQRPRFSAASKMISGMMLMSWAQLAVFEDFFLKTLHNGALAFIMPDVDGVGTYTARFTDKIYTKDFNGTKWSISLNLERLP